MADRYFEYGVTIGPPTAKDVILDPDKDEHYDGDQIRAALQGVRPEVDAIITKQKVNRLLGAVAQYDVDNDTNWLEASVPPDIADEYRRNTQNTHERNKGENNE